MKSNRRSRKGGAKGRPAETAAPPAAPLRAAAPSPLPVLPALGPTGSTADVRPVLEWLFTGYFVLLVMGFVLLRLPGTMASGNELNVDRAIFTSVNAGTLTGFQLTVGINQFKPGNPLGPAAVLLLTCGGTFFALATGGLLAVRILRLPYADGQVITAALTAMGVATVGGAIPLLAHDRGPYDALLLAAAAFGNSGVYTGAVPGVADARTHLVLLPLALAGGLGLPVLMELYDLALSGRPLSRHSRTVLWLTAGFYAGGTLLVLLVRGDFWHNFTAGLTGGGWTVRQGQAVRYALASSSVAAVNARTAGLPLEYANVLPRTAQWVVLALMAVGGSPASTAGGLKTTTIYQLARGVRSALAGRAPPRAFGIAGAWLAAYWSIVAAGFLGLLALVPQLSADQLLFLAVSAASNVGLSHDALSLVVGPLYLLAAVMALGRVVPLLVLWWMAETTGEADVVVA